MNHQLLVRVALNFMWLQRKSEGEHESSRRLKTQFLIEMEGFDSGNEQILLIGNNPPPPPNPKK